MGAKLTLSAVTVAFGGLRAVDGISTEFDGVGITGLIGPNGSGKSTLVNAISGERKLHSGRIRLGAVDITGARADRIVRHGLARTYQIPLPPPQLTIAEVIGVPLDYAAAESRLMPGLGDPASIARFCGIRRSMDTLCRQLSVPDLRRLELARALACGPAMLLLDEVMAGLSQEDAAQMVDIVRRINAAGIGILVIEHVMRIIADLCHDILVMNNGRVLAQGAPRDVLADPAVREAYLGEGFSL